MVLESVRRAGGEKGGSGAASVILVDDDAAAADMYAAGLAALGFDVRIAGNGADLFLMLDQQLPDVVVLDWRLPGMRGDEILLRIRLDERTRSLPVFMLSDFPRTAHETEGVIDRVFLAGVVAWLEKVKTPPSALAEKLTEALKARSAESVRRSGG
jgi:CheY-like chemotaxis protein